ncbi:MAG: hypothetical protein PHO48_01635 [Candidatus Gracilibacteria bacterium]|nr:hypothetical protein [Candidatus Gracilibacteria bacterium]
MTEKLTILPNPLEVDSSWVQSAGTILKPEDIFPSNFSETALTIPPTDIIFYLKAGSPILGEKLEALIEKFQVITQEVREAIRTKAEEDTDFENLKSVLAKIYRLQIEFCLIARSYVTVISQSEKRTENGNFPQVIGEEISRLKKNEGILALLKSLYEYINNILLGQKEAILSLQANIEAKDRAAKKLREIYHGQFENVLAEGNFSFEEAQAETKEA